MAQTLLERYFAGETSLEEEARLRTYFQKTEVPPELEAYRSLFGYFTAEKQRTVDSAFAERMSRPQPSARRKALNSPYWYARAAAVLILLSAAAWLLMPIVPVENAKTTIDWSRFEPQDEEEALRVTAAAFRKTSSSLRRGLEAATQELNNVKKIVQPF